MNTLYDFVSEIEKLFDKALNKLSPEEFDKFLDNVDMMLSDYQS